MPEKIIPKHLTQLFLPDIMANIFSFLEEDDENTQLFFLILVRSPNYRASFCGPGAGALYPELSKQDLRLILLHNNLLFELKKILPVFFTHPDRYPFLADLQHKRKKIFSLGNTLHKIIFNIIFFSSLALAIMQLAFLETCIADNKNSPSYELIRYIGITPCNWNFSKLFIPALLIFPFATMLSGMRAIMFIYFLPYENAMLRLGRIVTNILASKKLKAESKYILDYIQQPILFQIPKRRKPAETSAAAAVAVHIP